MGREHGLIEEFHNNGVLGVAKRLFYYIPNHYVIEKVKQCPFEYGLYQGTKRDKKIIVSLTSYPPRFNNIHLCLKSLLCQSMKADKIIVWFGSDTDETKLTEKMKELQRYGIEYRYDRKHNLKPHKKYFYAMQEFPDDIVITVDDDSVYPHNTIESLYNSYRNHPNCVSARRVHKMTFRNGALDTYDNWKKEYRKERKESHKLVAVGVGGVLYPPRCLPIDTFDIDTINELCLGADDIWLKCMELLKGTKVVWVPCFFCHPPALSITTSLWQRNVAKNSNDKYIFDVAKKYKIDINKN